ncbi:class I SAM-dependent methyltransferase [Thalassoroseus pseudoceratinae]|uniref:class I SAM-dependent methyltransferase n=1 Tax=Thalassoroseus pseudoceratinae TaxID=2713176 RepID=UPI001420E645|nr:class I SAM-dependent methyltransferase [Thalassoroseus pseudoceratinae]
MSAVPFPAIVSRPKPKPSTTGQSTPIELESVACLLCEGNRFSTVIVAPDPLTKLGGNFRVVRCSDCGLHFTNPRPTVNSIGMFYPDDYACWSGQEKKPKWKDRLRQSSEHLILRRYFGYPNPTSMLESFWANVGAAWISRSDRRQDWIPWRSPGRLLDFGCGAGAFLQAMQRHGWDVCGMDMSAACAAGVTERTGIPVHVGTLPHPDLKPESFDAVTMWNALEHVHEPRETLTAANQLLRRGGIVVVGVPNIDSWAFRQFHQDWYPLKLPRHLTHFTPLTLQEMVYRCGFRPLQLDHISRPHFLRKSARMAVANGQALRWPRILKNKHAATAVANWTERTRQAEFIRVVAEKV